MSLGLHLIFDVEGPTSVEVWRLLQESHPDLLSGRQSCVVDGVRCSLNTVGAFIRRRVKPYFDVQLGDDEEECELSYCPLPNCRHALLCIEGILSAPADADVWVQPFLGCDSFRQAWLFDCEYAYWQNAEDPLEYTTVGKSYAHLPTKSNGWPPPLEQTIIDTSGNPGRREIRDGYVEAIGAVMWFGRSFWDVVGANRDAVVQSDLVVCREQENGTLRVQAAEKPFTSAEGCEGELQHQLRSLIFPTRE